MGLRHLKRHFPWISASAAAGRSAVTMPSAWRGCRRSTLSGFSKFMADFVCVGGRSLRCRTRNKTDIELAKMLLYATVPSIHHQLLRGLTENAESLMCSFLPQRGEGRYIGPSGTLGVRGCGLQ